LQTYKNNSPCTPTGPYEATLSVADLGLDAALVERLAMAGPLCFLDFEATGLDHRSDALIEAGAGRIEPGSSDIRIFNSYIHTDIVLSPFIQRLTGISQDDLSAAPPLAEVAKALDAFIGDTPVVAHNIRFEQTWLAAFVNPRFADHPFLDTVELLSLVYPDSRNLKLDTFCRDKLERRERHRALDDALDTLRITVGIFAESAAGDPAAVNASRALRAFYPSSPWLKRLEAAPTSSVARAKPTITSDDGGWPEAVTLEFGAIAQRLRDESTARRVIPGYEFREQQISLLRNAFECFAGKKGRNVHICEAGTGIGKTLAYLAVAIPFARETGEKVIISTSSKILQRQLVEKDIPAAARLFGYPALRFTAIKGRANYLCRARTDAFLDASSSLLLAPDEPAIALLAAFAASAGHGELDRIPGVLYSMYPQLESYRREVTSGDASECSRQSCETTRGDCTFREARAQLEGADIIVVNHDLLLRWPPDYPELKHLIVDEVHELAERADGAYARSAEGVELVHRLDAILGRKGRDPIANDEELAARSRRAIELIKEVGEEASALVGADPRNHSYRDELAVPLDGPGTAWAVLVDAVLDLAKALDEIGRRLAEIADQDDSPAAGAAEALLDASVVLRESFPIPPGDLVVRFRGLARQSTTAWRLVATPVSPAADFQMEILDRIETLFGTSATVAVGGDTRGALGTLELAERAGSRFQLDAAVASPFDYRNNLKVLFVDERTDREALVGRTSTAISTVARVLGGRTMALFTSRDRLAKVSDGLFSELATNGISVIAPSTGNADPHDLVRSFAEADHAVLFGARAFWQGIDVPGDACQAVIIEKLPFDVPSDPLIQRRGQLIERDSGNSFMDYMLPRMLLRLKQMIGRLIRTPSDRGIVVIVEPRCDRRYFPKLLDALPPEAEGVRVRMEDLEATVREFMGKEVSADE